MTLEPGRARSSRQLTLEPGLPSEHAARLATIVDVTKESTDGRAGYLLRRARQQGALSQADVAARAGVPQSTVSAYESGRRQPTLPMLSKLLEAMGAELTLNTATAPAELNALTGPTGVRLRRHRHQIIETALRHGAENVRALGAVTRGAEQSGEPVELLVDQNPAATAMSLLALQNDLQELIGVPVKILTSELFSQDIGDSDERRGIVL